MRWRGVVLLTAIALALGACASVHNLPLNTPTASPLMPPTGHAAAMLAADQLARGEDDGATIGLAFSGGGTRAAAFAFGVLEAIGAHARAAGW